jgi:hypothetical protein
VPASFGAALTPGNVAIYRVGTGSGSLINTGNAVFIDEYTPAGVLVQSIAMPTTASGSNKPLIASGTATSEGLLTRSSDGQYLMLTGYGSTLPAAGSLAGTASATVNRVVGRVDGAGAIDTSTALSDFADGNNPRKRHQHQRHGHLGHGRHRRRALHDGGILHVNAATDLGEQSSS